MIIPALDCLPLADKASNSTAIVLAQPTIPLLARQLQTSASKILIFPKANGISRETGGHIPENSNTTIMLKQMKNTISITLASKQKWAIIVSNYLLTLLSLSPINLRSLPFVSLWGHL